MIVITIWDVITLGAIAIVLVLIGIGWGLTQFDRWRAKRGRR